MYFMLRELLHTFEHGKSAVYTQACTHVYRKGYLVAVFLNPPSDDRLTGLLSNVTAISK